MNTYTAAANRIDRFPLVYEDHAYALRKYLLRLTGNAEDAADLAQEAFLKYYCSDVLPEAARGWLYRTAYHLFVDLWRSRARRNLVPLEHIPELPDTQQLNPETICLRREWVAEVCQALRRLPDRDRKALMLRGRHDAAYKEIAVKIGCSEVLVKTILFRARAKMRLTKLHM